MAISKYHLILHSGTSKFSPAKPASMSIDVDSEASIATSDIEKFGKLLGEAISNLSEYKTYEQLRDEVKKDIVAQDLINEFENQRQTFMVKRASGDATKEDLDKIGASQETLNNLPVMVKFLDAQKELSSRLSETNEHISESLSLDFGDQIGGCGCS
tara:strand:- start:247 stop:717 length:471 start_codon:yes stop_codon:yes gene_type:complete